MKVKMERKDVIYNGGNGSFYHYSDPKDLIPWKPYLVKKVIDRGFQTEYEFYDVEGSFNSEWFDEVKKQVLVYSDKTPQLHERMLCVDINTGDLITTSSVQYVEPITSNFYKVITRSKSLYITVVLN